MQVGMIRTANQQNIVKKMGGLQKLIDRECVARWNHYPNWHANKKIPPLKAFVHRSDWVAKCECGSQVVVEPSFPLFYCPNCLNVAAGYMARVVQFPPIIKKTAIEKILLARWYPQNRNWLPEETVADLLKENRMHKEVTELPDNDPDILAALQDKAG